MGNFLRGVENEVNLSLSVYSCMVSRRIRETKTKKSGRYHRKWLFFVHWHRLKVILPLIQLHISKSIGSDIGRIILTARWAQYFFAEDYQPESSIFINEIVKIEGSLPFLIKILFNRWRGMQHPVSFAWSWELGIISQVKKYCEIQRYRTELRTVFIRDHL